jgi:hypothetical protein
MMKKIILFVFIMICRCLSGQALSIQYFEQNDSISLFPKIKETKEDNSFALYPNPFTSELTILTDLPGTVEFMLFNNVSELVIDRKFQEMITLNTSGLSPGIYYYRAKDVKGHYALGKIVKER